MKYFPLIWSALLRKPTEAILTLASVTVGFTLFGLMIAVNTTYQQVIDNARQDRLYVTQRFGGPGLPVGLRDQIARIDGVTAIGASRSLRGYHQDPGNPVSINTMDEGMRLGWSELPLSAEQWDRLLATPTGVFFSRKAADRWNVEQNDTFPIITPPGTRADGATSWIFTVLGVIDDAPEFTNGVIIGNYNYYDNERPAADQGRAGLFRLAVDDPERANEIGRNIDRLFANSDTPTFSVSVKTDTRDLANSVINIASITRTVAAAGLFMILFLIGNGIAESVRERISEFAVLKTLGFGDRGILALVFLEAAVPCFAGAIVGMTLAAGLAPYAPGIVPTDAFFNMRTPVVSPAVWASALGCAVALAFASTIVPVLRLRRLEVATALAPTGR